MDGVLWPSNLDATLELRKSFLQERFDYANERMDKCNIFGFYLHDYIVSVEKDLICTQAVLLLRWKPIVRKTRPL